MGGSEMETFTRKKVEMFIERPLLARVLSVIRDNGAKGYTVLPTLEGHGQDGTWSEGLPVAAQTMVQVVVITSEDRATSILDGIKPILETWPGVVCAYDVQVLRRDRF